MRIAGKRLRMMVDSGSCLSLLTIRAWQAIGAPPSGSIGGYATGAGGDAQIDAGLLEAVDTGHAIARQQVFVLSDTIMPTRPGDPPPDGMPGYDFLDNFDFGFDLPDNRVTL